MTAGSGSAASSTPFSLFAPFDFLTQDAVVFHEALNAYEMAGLVTAIAALILLTRFA